MQKQTVITTLTRSQMAHVQRMIMHKQQAEQLEKFLAGCADFVLRPQLLQLSGQELDEAQKPFDAWLQKLGLSEKDNVNITVTGEVVRTEDVPDDESSDADHSSTSDPDLQRIGEPTESRATSSPK